MVKPNIISQHRQLAKKAIHEKQRRKRDGKPNGWSDAAIEYMIRQNPGADLVIVRDEGILNLF